MMPRWFLPLLFAQIPLVASSEIIALGDNFFVDHTLVANQQAKEGSEASQPDPAGDDLILFQNGDLMHGTFGGIEEGLIWERADITRPIKFGLPGIKQVVFKSTRRLPLDQKTSFVTLASGDRIPGEIISLDDQNLTLKSPIIGNVTIPRDLLRTISPNPFNGKLHYIGPYTSDGWLALGYRKNEEQLEKEKKAAEEAKAKGDKAKEKKESSSWIHSGAAFYSQGTLPLILPDANLPDVGRVRFNVAWKGNFYMTIAFHSDLTRVLPAIKKEEEKEDEEEEGAKPAEEGASIEEEQKEEKEAEPKPPAPLRKENLNDLRQGKTFQSVPWIDPSKKSHSDLFGTGYTLNLRSSYPTLTRNLFSETGTPLKEALSTSHTSSSLSQSGEAEIEIRFDREKSLIMLFIDGVYTNQWNDLSGYLGEGTALGFANIYSASKLRISEIVISSWEGSTDSARSMTHPDRDIALLTNGTDRFSGELSTISNGLAQFKTGYTDAQIPLADLSLISLKSSAMIDLEGDGIGDRYDFEDESVTVIYEPFGLIKLNPLSSTATTIKGNSPFLGDISVELAPALMLRFTDDSPDLSDWFDDF
ncbi:MAG: hypothetical protein ACJAQT_001226 [Akkermansiaceae bacterium]|jgi:hypothetical protein